MTELILICKKHHCEINIIPAFHFKKKHTDCPNCRIDKLQENFIKKAIEIHGDKYDYSKVKYVDGDTKVIIICKKHNIEFEQTIAKHINCKHGCIHCGHTVSRAETEWLDFLGVSNEIRQKIIKINGEKFRLDAIDKKNKIIWEFYGNFWHGNPRIFASNAINVKNKRTFGELYQETLEKEKILKDAGYTLITIWEDEWNEIKKNFKI